MEPLMTDESRMIGSFLYMCVQINFTGLRICCCRKKREDLRSEPAESIPSKSQKEAMAPKRQNRMFGPKSKRKQSNSSPVVDNNPIKNSRPIKDVIELLDSGEFYLVV